VDERATILSPKFRLTLALVIAVLSFRWLPASAGDYKVIEVRPGEIADVFFEVNAGGTVFVRIVAESGNEACGDFWWVTWPLGRITQLGRRCNEAQFAIPGLLNFAVSSRLRVGGIRNRAKIIAGSTAQVANSVKLEWP
jgi:hypothetical protein